MRNFNDANREHFNQEFIKRDNRVAVECLKKIAYSCERDRYFTLKVLETREIWDYDEIYSTLREYEEKKKKKGKNSENPYDYINIKDSDFMLLAIKYFIRHNGIERQEIKKEGRKKEQIIVTNPWEILEVLIAIPIFRRKYYYRLNGNYYDTSFQIVDGSTYNNANIVGAGKKKADCNTFKTMFTPIKVYRTFKNLVDFYSKNQIRCVLYTSMIFDTTVNFMDYIISNYGLYGAFHFLDIHCVRISSEPISDDKWYNFQRHDIFISCPKECIADPMIQSLVVTIYDIVKKNTSVDMLFNIRFWLQNLGKSFRNASVDKGLFMLDSIDGVYDIITHESLRLPEEEKKDIYSIFRWLMREFEYINDKDNIDITLKRMREPGEYISHIYATKMSTGLKRASELGKRVTLHTVIKFVNTQPMWLINQIINMNNLVDYRDLVNDNDGNIITKFTYKGISGLGDNGANVPQLYKHVNATHAGILDLDASTESDPGMSGLVCPMAQLYENYYFSDYQEPNFWYTEKKPIQENFFKEAFKPIIIDESIAPPSYLGLRQKVIKESLDIDKPVCPLVSLDGSTDYTMYASQLNREKEENKDKKSLFTIKKED